MKSDERIRDVLYRQAASVVPRPLSARTLRRGRALQAAWLLFVLVSVLGVTIAAGAIVRLPRTDRTVIVAPPGSSAVVYLADAIPGKTGQTLAASGGVARWSVPIGYDPSIVVSADGAQLYVASRQTPSSDTATPGADVLTTIDTATGTVLSAASLQQPDTSRTRIEHQGADFYPRLAISPAGNLIYVLQFSPGSQLDQKLSVGTFDTATGAMLPQSVPLDDCGRPPVMVPLAEPRRLAVVCADGPTTAEVSGTQQIDFQPAPKVLLLSIATDGSATSIRTVPIPASRGTASDPNGNPIGLAALVDGLVTPDGRTLVVFTRGGERFQVDTQTGQVSDSPSLALPAGFVVAPNRVVASADGSILAAGLRSINEFDSVAATRLVEFDVRTGSLATTIMPQAPFYVITAPNGGSVYALTASSAGVLSIDLQTGRQVRLAGLGNSVVAATSGRDEILVQPGD